MTAHTHHMTPPHRSRDPSAPVDEAVDAVLEDALHLLLHLLLLGRLDLSYFSGGVHAHSGAEDLRTHTLALGYRR